MTAPVTAWQPPEQPRSGMTAAQLAALLALIQAQSDIRLRLTQTAVAGALAAFDALADWWNPGDINRAIQQALRVVQPSQRQAARITDAYLARALSLMTDRRVDPVGAVDVTRLRRALPEKVAHDLVDGRRRPGYVVIGDTATGAYDTIDEPVPLTVRDDPQVEWLDPSEPYGRVADQYRFDVVAKGVPEEKAKEKALVRIQTAVHTDITLAVRAMYEKGLKRNQVGGWRRIVHPELSKTGPCGLCVVAANRVYAREDLQPIHDNCVCEVLPVVKLPGGGRLDPGYELNDQELKALYAAAGGTGGNPKRQAGHLKDVRVAIAEHAELGAVLVDADQHYRGPVEVARTKVKAPESPEVKRHQLSVWESTYEKLLIRAVEGEQLDRPIEFQRKKIAELRRELGLPEHAFV